MFIIVSFIVLAFLIEGFGEWVLATLAVTFVFVSWIKIDQLDVTCFIISLFTAQHVSNVSTSIFRSLRLTVDLFHGLYCSGSKCVGVTVWFGWGGVVSLCRLKLRFNLHKHTTPPQPDHTVTPTHFEPEQYNPWNKSTISRKLLKMDVLTFETCWAVNSEIIKQVTSRWSIFIQLKECINLLYFTVFWCSTLLICKTCL